MTDNEAELNAAFEKDLRSLKPDQLRQVAGIVDRVRAEPTEQQSFQKKVARMSDNEFETWRREVER